MGVFRNVGARLEKIDDAAEAARDSLATQATLNVVLAVGVGVAILIAIIALGRSGHDAGA